MLKSWDSVLKLIRKCWGRVSFRKENLEFSWNNWLRILLAKLYGILLLLGAFFI